MYSCYRFQKHTFDSSVMNGFGWCRNNLSRSKKILTRRAHHWWMHLNSSVFHRDLTFLHCLIDDRFVLFSSSLLMPTPLHFKASSAKNLAFPLVERKSRPGITLDDCSYPSLFYTNFWNKWHLHGWERLENLSFQAERMEPPKSTTQILGHTQLQKVGLQLWIYFLNINIYGSAHMILFWMNFLWGHCLPFKVGLSETKELLLYWNSPAKI